MVAGSEVTGKNSVHHVSRVKTIGMFVNWKSIDRFLYTRDCEPCYNCLREGVVRLGAYLESQVALHKRRS
jgi:hypothetical protein